ncbi:molybdenum cofactor guanylyltransferase [Demequina sediminicola]|uniref:molybdenum cofactor guanylyltransferase n=1 Tax=Demequina sediminicola TaxID=1095026 RepID=UPI0007867A9F|nr:molybdenum cofactor guanylyltransferase [Demequina sediminicola]
MNLDAIVLSGGRASRLGGVDKGAIDIGGETMLQRTLRACAAAREVVVVGDADRTSLGEQAVELTVVREDPPYGGPVAGLAAGMRALPRDTDLVLVVACDMPLAVDAVPPLVEASSAAIAVAGETARQCDGAWACDDGGTSQPLLAVYVKEALVAALAQVGDPDGASMRALTGGLVMTSVPAGAAARDADTWNDVERLREEIS